MFFAAMSESGRPKCRLLRYRIHKKYCSTPRGHTFVQERTGTEVPGSHVLSLFLKIKNYSVLRNSAELVASAPRRRSASSGDEAGPANQQQKSPEAVKLPGYKILGRGGRI